MLEACRLSFECLCQRKDPAQEMFLGAKSELISDSVSLGVGGMEAIHHQPGVLSTAASRRAQKQPSSHQESIKPQDVS